MSSAGVSLVVRLLAHSVRWRLTRELASGDRRVPELASGGRRVRELATAAGLGPGSQAADPV